MLGILGVRFFLFSVADPYANCQALLWVCGVLGHGQHWKVSDLTLLCSVGGGRSWATLELVPGDPRVHPREGDREHAQGVWLIWHWVPGPGCLLCVEVVCLFCHKRKAVSNLETSICICASSFQPDGSALG